jgi:hypothetical protein
LEKKEKLMKKIEPILSEINQTKVDIDSFGIKKILNEEKLQNEVNEKMKLEKSFEIINKNEEEIIILKEKLVIYNNYQTNINTLNEKIINLKKSIKKTGEKESYQDLQKTVDQLISK